MTVEPSKGRISTWLRQLSGILERHRKDTYPSQAPDGLLIYAIGDIHGRSDLLDELLEHIRLDAAASPALCSTLIFLGDYVDRGFASKSVIDTLVRLSDDSARQVITLMGNHEEAMLRFLEDAELGPGWAQHGGLETLLSYGVTPPSSRADRSEWELARIALAEGMPASHHEFLKALTLSESIGDYIFVHAGIRPGIAFQHQEPHDLLWIRDEFLEADLKLKKTVVHGHTPSDAPSIGRSRIGVDTGAYATGVLTALRLEGEQRAFLQTGTRPGSVT